ncbi:hypothetical protein P5673_033623 [Acropora cervicornis]|uniref:Uncharacterized protein n=1 Tax=Acropora cervicornis TaxID=6130 RepID=A0AAD9PPQ3_ACRCE|nr:hypothetical protein P5673_033623 [Acropora cervicornis]
MSTLLYSVGDCAEDILPTLCLDETKATYDQVRATLNGEPHKRYSKSAMKPENGTRSKPERKCMWCGGQQHKRQSCPAKDVSCNSCHQRGQAVYLSKKHAAKRTCINEVADLEEAEVLSLDEIYSGEADVWTAIAKLDTGEAISIVGDKEPWLKHHQLTKSQQISRGPAGTILSVVDTFRTSLTYKEHQISETVLL